MVKNKKKILVVDDEVKIVQVLKAYLEKYDYTVYEAFNGKDAISLFEKVAPSLMILDLMLPDISGEEVCSILRKTSRVPIIMLTAKAGESDIVNGLNYGADDYIIKPFRPNELIARVIALLRRTQDEILTLSSILTFNNGELIINEVRHEVTKGGQVANLTPKEYKILLTLASHPKKLFTREELLSIVFDEYYDGFDRTIDTHIKNLRQKIEDNSKMPKYIITVHGLGYRFGDE